VAVAFAVGITASLIADARDPDADAKRAERAGRTTASQHPESTAPEPEPATRD
jgi:hypothetical protein